MSDIYQRSRTYHCMNGVPGKLTVLPSKPLRNQEDLSLAYTPGVAQPVRDIAADKDSVYKLTNKGNLIAVLSNGSAVLGLGDQGALASKPVMEGKAVLFKKFADIDVFDIEVDTSDPERLVEVAACIAPTFGGINLEDIKAPECFYVQEELGRRVDIPVFHDDQYGTAAVVGAAVLNGLYLAGKSPEDIKLVCLGAGAAGTACCRMLFALGLKPDNLRMIDPFGVIYKGRPDTEAYKLPFAADTKDRTLEEAMRGADVFLGVSAANLVSRDMVKSMNRNPLVLPLANPVGEISYEEAAASRSDIIIGTGRSDYPNQINNVLGFPYIFRGALDVRASCVNEAMLKALCRSLAELARLPVPEEVLRAYGLKELCFGPRYILPKPLDPRLLLNCSLAAAKAAVESGAARIVPDWEEYKRSLERRRAKTALY